MKKLFKRYENWINNFNACPVVRVNINEYDIHENPDSLDPVSTKLHILFKHIEMSIIDKKTDFTVHSRQEGLELKNGYKSMFNSVLGCQYVINVENNN